MSQAILRNIFLIVFCLFAFSWLSCNRNDDSPQQETNYQYFPLKVGAEYIYKVDSIDYVRIPDTTHIYWLKEVVLEEVERAGGGMYHQIAIYHAKDSIGPWTKVRTDLAQNFTNRTERLQDNIQFKNLVYPIKAEREWEAAPTGQVEAKYGLKNGANIRFTETKYAEIHEPHYLLNTSFDSTVTVIQQEFYDFLTRVNFREKYINHVGLYSKIELHARYQRPDGGGDTSEYVPRAGFKRRQHLISYSIPE